MTLILAWRCTSGIVMHADSQETVPVWDGSDWVSYRKTVQKITPQEMGQFNVSIAGSGHGGLIDSFIVVLKRKLDANSAATNLNDFVSEFETALSNYYGTDVALCPDPDEDKRMKFIVAVHSKVTGEFDLWVTEAMRLRRIVGCEMAGHEEPLYDYVQKRLYSASMSLAQAVLAGIYILTIGEGTSNSIKSPFSVAVIKENGIWMEKPEYVSDVAGRLADYEQRINQIFLDCADTSVPVDQLAQTIDEFKSAAVSLHREHIDRMVSNLTFEAIMNADDPYPRLPFPHVITFGLLGFSIEHDSKVSKQRIEWFKKVVGALPDHPFFLQCANCKTAFEYRVEKHGSTDWKCPVCNSSVKVAGQVIKYRKIGTPEWNEPSQ